MKIAAHAAIAALVLTSALAASMPAAALTPDRGPPNVDPDLAQASTLKAAKERAERDAKELHQEYLRDLDRERRVNQGADVGGVRIEPDVDTGEPRIHIRFNWDWNPDQRRAPNFGRKSLNEIKEVLASMGLRLGMVRQVAYRMLRVRAAAYGMPPACRAPALPRTWLQNCRGEFAPDSLPGWPPENIEEMAKKLEQELLG